MREIWEIISKDVFAAGWKSLNAKIRREKPRGPMALCAGKPGTQQGVDVTRDQGPVEQVWAKMRDFAGMGSWHDEITRMHMLGRVRSDKVSGVRDFYFGDDHLEEELLHLCDLSRSFSYRIIKCEIPWLNYVSGPRLWPVTADNTTFGVWTGDWVPPSRRRRSHSANGRKRLPEGICDLGEEILRKEIVIRAQPKGP